VGLLWWLLVVGHESTEAPAELGARVRPASRTPVAVAAGLRGQQVEQRVAVPGIVRGRSTLVKKTHQRKNHEVDTTSTNVASTREGVDGFSQREKRTWIT
jgi:hypothetical protein